MQLFCVCIFVVGFSTSQPDYLKFLFEMNEDFCTFPTFGVIPAFGMNMLAVPGLESIDVTRVSVNE